MKKSIIVAIGSNRVIGKDNDLIWHLPRDLKFFKKMTTGHAMLMGSNTYLAIGKPLPNRKHIVISRNKNFEHEQITMSRSIESGIEIAKGFGETELFISGGGKVYEYCLNNNLVDKIYLSVVHENFEGDTFFPELNKNSWQEISNSFYKADEKNKHAISFKQLIKVA